MGKRARNRGVTNAMLRAAHAVAQQTDERCADIARHVYDVARELRQSPEPEPMPLEVMAPVTAAAERAAFGAAAAAGLDARDERLVADIAAYLVTGFREFAVALDVTHFEEWRRGVDEAVASPPQTGTPTDEEARGGGSDLGGPAGGDAGAQPGTTDAGSGEGEQDSVGAGGAEGGGEDGAP